MHITLLIPDLPWPAADDSTTPALKTLLARGRLNRSAPLPLEHALCQWFGHAPDTACAAFRRLGETGLAAGSVASRWLCADPVHLHFYQNRLALVDGQQLNILPEEAQELVAALNVELADIGRFEIASPARWYFQPVGQALPPLSALPLSVVAGGDVDEEFSDILDAPDWRRQITAIQTVLHAHPLNRRREDAGRLTINSLWLWGDGRLPARRESRFDSLWSTHPLLCGLARAAGVPTHPVPSDAARLLAHAAPGTQALIMLEDLSMPPQYEDPQARHEALVELESKWFAPLKNALAAGQIRHFYLYAPGKMATLEGDCARTDLWKFWRRNLPRSEN